MSQRKAKKELQATDELGRTARVIGSLNFLFILFAFLFQVVLASVLVSIFQCDAVERFGPKYLVAGCLGWPLGRNRSTGAFSQIRKPERVAAGHPFGDEAAEVLRLGPLIQQSISHKLDQPAEGRGARGLDQDVTPMPTPLMWLVHGLGEWSLTRWKSYRSSAFAKG